MPALIAYPGTVGSFSHGAAKEMLPGAECIGYETFEGAMDALLEKKVNYCLLPVENSFAGAVLPSYRLMEMENVHIVGEHMRRVKQNLLALPGATMSDIRVIESHPQAIAQSDDFLRTLTGVQIVPGVNTAVCAKHVAESGDKSLAAIASLDAAEEYGLQVLKEDIQTSKTNTTRFFLLSLNEMPIHQPNKATIVFTVNNEVGALLKVLVPFSESGLNMCRIESRPLPDTPFQYFFSADFDGLHDYWHLCQAMDAARPYTQQMRLLGLYAKAEA